MAGDPSSSGPGGAKAGPKVPVTFEPVGLKKFASQMGGWSDVMLGSLMSLSSGATASQAALSGIGTALELKILGPLGLMGGAAVAALAGLNKLTQEWKEMGKVGAASLEMMTTQFKPLLGSIELAKERVEELVEVTKTTPFRQNDVIAANKTLQVLTQGALATKDAMLLVGDAAAVAGSDLDTTATWVGRLYDALQSGSPIGESTMRLQELGLITGGTRRELEAMVEGNASFVDMWSVVEGQLKKSKGSMNDLSQTLDGLQSTLDDTADILGATFTKGFMEGEADQLRTYTAILEGLTPVAKEVGEVLGSMSNSAARSKREFVESITKTELFGQAITVLATGALAVLGGMILQSVIWMGRFALGFRAMSAASKASTAAIQAEALALAASDEAMGINLGVRTKLLQAIKLLMDGRAREAAVEALSIIASTTSTAGMTAEAAATATLTAAKAAHTSVVAALVKGNIALAMSNLRVAAAETLAAVRAAPLTNSLALLKAGFFSLARGIVFAIQKMVMFMATALLNGPMLLATALVALVAAIYLHNKHMEDARKRQEEFAKATKDTVGALQQKIRAIRTVNDLIAAENEATEKLIAAKKALMEAERSGSAKDVALAQDRVKAIEEGVLPELEETRKNKGGLAMTDQEKDKWQRDRAEEEEVKRLDREERRGKMNAEELAKDKEAEYKEELKKKQDAIRDRDKYKETQKAQDDQAPKEKERAEERDLQARLEMLQADKKAYRDAFGGRVEDDQLLAPDGMSEEDKREFYKKQSSKLFWEGNFFQKDENGAWNPAAMRLAGKDPFADLTPEEQSKLSKEDQAKRWGDTRIASRLKEFEDIPKLEAKLREVKEKNLSRIGGYEIGLTSDSREKVLESRKSLRESIMSRRQTILDNTDSEGNLKEGANISKEKLADTRREMEVLSKLADGITIQKPDWWEEGNDKMGDWKIATDAKGGAARQSDLDDLNLKKLRADNEKNISPSRLKELQIAKDREADQLKKAAARDDLETEKAINGLKDLGLETKLKELDIERRKLDLALQNKEITDAQYANAMKVLDAEKTAAEDRSKRAREQSRLDTILQNVDINKEAYRRVGDKANYEDQKKIQDVFEERRDRFELGEQSKEMGGTEEERKKWVDQQVALRKRARDQARQFEKEDEEFAQKQSESQGREDFLTIREGLKRAKGDDRGADADRTASRSEADTRNEADYKKKYIDMGYDAQEADRRAKRDVVKDQINRGQQDIDELGNAKVVAHSLARVGGGGGVAMYDPALAKQEMANKLLERIEKAIKEQKADDTLGP